MSEGGSDLLVTTLRGNEHGLSCVMMNDHAMIDRRFFTCARGLVPRHFRMFGFNHRMVMNGLNDHAMPTTESDE